MKKTILNIIRKQTITTVFQPIFDVTKRDILGYEALTRGPVNSEFYAPDRLFYYATEYGLLSELEILCRDKAISKFAQLKLAGLLFINVSPMVLLDKQHPQGRTKALVEQAGMCCNNIVIELSEKYPTPNDDTLCEALNKYRQFGFKVAIDDLGVGYSDLKLWSQLQPDLVKIDQYFVRDCHIEPFKGKFLKAIFDLAQCTNAHVIVEGIETKREFDFLIQLGMRYAQGFYLAKPKTMPALCYPDLTNNASTCH